MKRLDRACRITLIVLLLLCVCMSPALASAAEQDLSGKTDQTALCNIVPIERGLQRIIQERLFSYLQCADKEFISLPPSDKYHPISQNKDNCNDIAQYQDDPSTRPVENYSPVTNIDNNQEKTVHNNGTAYAEEVFVAEVIRLVNAQRIASGLSPLTESSLLDQAASVRCSEIMTAFSHTRPDGSSCFTALQDAGAVYSRAGENIAIGQSSPAQVVQAWMDSPGHRANIMNEGFRYIGVSARPSEDSYGGYAWVQIFTD